ncbi:hypothetical protein ASPWEDRAFT_38616 [Aspergillus wentii DTO 134E9]|uniref:Nucleoside phosphorylase domain-containing protein n=1 Tax=Aspergillus wentii DTO 134E9 TaxID=1073089 RepID=A0A1L9RPV0_ASPWE|nr:uncharacterized protein ASPWEDRAFT_38616 [Aspergillus wentii DTO 134E9]OJJ36954.1 hypothetical protein ASPWEDRAFT_38616 [Aspergillus wentii DTO 134E9]
MLRAMINGVFKSSAQHDHPQDAHPPTVQMAIDIQNHTMCASTKAYIAGKIHPTILLKPWSRIIVKGNYKRTGPNTHISPTEMDKRCNRHRPTATVVDDETLEINCFPGRDYVRHYAMLIASHLGDGSGTVVEYVLPEREECLDVFIKSNLQAMGRVHTVVVGSIEDFVSDESGWESGSDDGQIFAWRKMQNKDGTSIAFLACVVSLWGDITEYLVRALHSLNHVSRIIYIGKAGSLHPRDKPNHVIVTGDETWFDKELIQWDNAITIPTSGLTTTAISGNSVTVSSPLVESREWLLNWGEKADWVDCEVGNMIRVCRELHISFGYLHVISDNLASWDSQNLATEDGDEVVACRRRLLGDMWYILKENLRLDDGSSLHID